jgi:TolB-like protein/Tfp pilus assembly protein PilF
VEAVESACEIQQVLRGRNLELPADRRMAFRIGVNLGDVIEDADGAIYGDGVNIAARMEALADTGGICISSSVYDAVEGKLEFGFDFLGAQQVKNIAKLINVYRVRTADGGAPPGNTNATPKRLSSRLIAVLSIIAVLLAAGVVLRPYLTEPPQTETEVAALPLPDEPSIAVLPFANLSDDAEQAFFADGMTEDIITALSRFTEMFVIAPNSSFKYRDDTVDIGEVGRDLGVRYVLQGSVRRSGDQARITTQLVDATTGGHLWSETYDRDLADSFQVQAEIAQNIAGVLAPRIAHDAYERASREAPADLAVFESVAHARQLFFSTRYADLISAHGLLENALERDPDYAPALALFSEVLLAQGWLTTDPDLRSDLLAQGGQAAQRAVALGPFDYTSHLALAQYYFFTKRLDLFEAEAKRTLDLNPNSAYALSNLAVRITQAFGRDRLGETEAMIRRAMRLDPHHPAWFHETLSRMLFFTGRYDEAQTQINKAALADDYPWGHYWTALIQAQLGNLETSQAAAQRFLKLQPGITMRALIDQWNLHESYWDTYIEAAAKAGIPLGDIESITSKRP